MTTPSDPSTSPIGDMDDVIITSNLEDDAPTATPETPLPDVPIENTDDSLDTISDVGDLEDTVFSDDTVHLRNVSDSTIGELFQSTQEETGAKAIDQRVQQVGTWENIMYRALTQPDDEEVRQRESLNVLIGENGEIISDRLVDPVSGKTVFKTSPIRERIAPGEKKVLTGDAAMMAFECDETGGGYRVMLYNSGISLDILTPTGNDIQTMVTNCLAVDKQLGASSGAHFFTYNDLMYKTQIMQFINPLIINSSYADWRSRGKLWSVIKLPDLAGLMLTIAAMAYPKGFENFEVTCTRPKTEDHAQCRHTEKLTADLLSMIITRHSVLSHDAIAHMTEARMRSGGAKHQLQTIAKYQADLGFEGKRIKFGKYTFVMRVPNMVEHVEAGNAFLTDIISEIEGDNTQGRYEQFGFRFMRTFLPWIGSVEVEHSNGAIVATSDPKVIARRLERLDEQDADDILRDTLLGYIRDTQLTYVGYPNIPCTACGFVADTPSGLMTFDPFNTFFILAFSYLTRAQ